MGIDGLSSLTIEIETDDASLIQQEAAPARQRMKPQMKPERRNRMVRLAVLWAVLALIIILGTALLIVLFTRDENTKTSLEHKDREPSGGILSLSPSAFPTTAPSLRPTPLPSAGPTTSPTLPPSVSSTPQPSRNPTMPPNPVPTSVPSRSPTSEPTNQPTPHPSPAPTEPPSAKAVNEVTTFYAIGDVPYSDDQAEDLKVQLDNLPEDAEFVIHVGDLRKAGEEYPCKRKEYEDVASILQRSHAPVFVILGDNDWNDCPNPNQGLVFWHDEFIGFEGRHWNHPFDIVRQPGREDNFSFVHKGTLFIGLNIVGGAVLSNSEWSSRLKNQADWTIALIREYSADSQNVGRVVIFGHANPTTNHRKFFNPLSDFIENELKNQVPVLYLNGDQHQWKYEPSFMGKASFLRIMVTGGTSEPPLKVEVHANGKTSKTNKAFQHDRQLS